jgi:CheY-like chemotaxis protein
MQRRILVIDDDAGVRASIKVILTSHGFAVTTAESGPAGLNTLKGASFDLAIIDVFMPDMDGIKTMKAVHQLNPSLPIIAISGVRLRLSGGTALDMISKIPGFAPVTCLQKPFRPRDLLAAVTSSIGAPA